jgi:hypothetical protein
MFIMTADIIITLNFFSQTVGSLSRTPWLEKLTGKMI